MSTMPDFVRRAIEAQGKVDPEEVERRAAEIENEGLREDEWQPLPADPDQEEFPIDELEEDRGY